ncbi:MAG: septal ring lytic transglycosylase RlpA family protein [Bryobacteraceae bacterium]
MRRVVAITAAALILLSGCARRKRARVAPLPAGTVKVGMMETGVASWYGHPYHGRAAASGEIYDMEQMTAAHRTLPFHTWVRVHDLDNGKTVDVRINDRGPFVNGRIIDLSRAAARRIAMIGPGTANVRLEVIRTAEMSSSGRFGVQVGAFRERSSAERLREQMQRRYGAARLMLRDGNPPVWRVVVGDEATEDGAGALAGRVRQETDARSAFVVRLDS